MKTYERKNLSVIRLTQGKLPRLPFLRLKEEILGKKYDLSIVFAGRELARKLKKKYLPAPASASRQAGRDKGKPANILSFPISKNSGEIIISLEQVRKEAPKFGKKHIDHLGALLIHGMLHLKDYRHGRKMQTVEQKFIKRFDFK